MKDARPIRRRRLLTVAALTALGALAAILLPLGCHGRRVDAIFAPNHGAAFDFASPPCAPAGRPDAGAGDVLVRYLGVSSLLVEWRGERILTAPFFSNPSPWQAAFGEAGWNEEAVRAGLDGVDVSRVGAVLTGHAHYDHLSDLPPLLTKMAPSASLYVNRSGANVLAAFPELERRTVVLDGTEGRWTRMRDGDGNPLPARLMPLASGHADHYGFFHYAGGTVQEPWPTWEGRRFRQMKEGQTFTFLIDLLDDDDRPVFRIFHQDASAPAPLGFPPAEVIAERPVDLAALCMPGHWQAKLYPEGVVERLQARHRMAIHYEDFFRPRGKPLRFVATLSDRRAGDFLEAMGCAAGSGAGAAAPACGCGPCGPFCSMPLPGDWLVFRAFPR